MQNNLTFLQILRLAHCELWQIKDRKSHCITRGHLQVLYSELINLFVLKLNDSKFALDQSLQITGVYNEKEKWNAYLWASFDGFFFLKIINPPNRAVISNFETILENTILFRQKPELVPQLGQYLTQEKHEGFFEKGLHKTQEAFSKFMAPHADMDTHPNQLMIRSFSDLMSIDSPDIPIVDISTTEVQNLKDEVNEVINHHQQKEHWRSMRGDETPIKQSRDYMNLEAKPIGLFRQHSGAENIRTTQTAHAQDQQEFVGTENQRLPSYEVQQTKETLMKGFRKASFNLSDPQKDQTTLQSVEGEEDFTVGLCSTCPIDMKSLYPVSQTQVREEPKIEKWGSNISNPSETSAGIRDEAEFGRGSNLSGQIPSYPQRQENVERGRGPTVSFDKGHIVETFGQTNLG